MMIWEHWFDQTLKAIFDGGVDRVVVGVVGTFLLRRMRTVLASAWRRNRGKLAASYGLVSAAPLWCKVVGGLALVWAVGGAMAGVIAGAMGHSVPVWAMAWYGHVVACLMGYVGWQGLAWAVRRGVRLLR